MKHRILPVCLAVLVTLTACGQRAVSPSEAAPESSAAAVSSEPLPESSAAPGVAGPPPNFQVPEQPYWIINESSWDNNQYLVIYEEAFPDEYNKQFSQDTVFHAIRWQLFDENWKLIEKGDSGWSNGFPIHDYVFAGQRPDNGTISFDAAMPAEYSTWPFRRRFTLVIDDSRQDLLKKDSNGGRIFLEDWYPLAEENGWKLEFLERYNAELDRQEMVLLMNDGLDEKRVTIEEYDRDFFTELYKFTRPGEVVFEGETPIPSSMTISFDPKQETAVFTIPKLTVTVDFKDKTTKSEYHYAVEQLQSKKDQSPDGRYSVHTTGEFDRFEGPSGSDYVVSGPDGVKRLFAGSEFDTVLFAGNDKIVANTIDGLTFYDPATGKPCEQQPAFDFGTAEYNGQAREKHLIVGLAVDQKNERILAAYRLNTFGNWELEVDGKTVSEFSVSLAVMDFSGKVLSQTDTELLVPAFGKFTLIPVQVKTDGAGNATLACDDAPNSPESVTVSYLA